MLLWNERGEVTETCVANLAGRIDGEWVTPPLSCGLLNGTYRSWLLDEGVLRERVITREMLSGAGGLQVFNSVRRIRQAVLLS